MPRNRSFPSGGVDRQSEKLNTLLEEGLNQISLLGAARSSSLEVVWSLWGLAAFRLKLSDSAAVAVAGSSHTIAKLLVRYIHTLGLCTQPTIVAVTDPWATDEWLLAHESLRRGYQQGFSHDALFSQLSNVEFLADIPEVVATEHLDQPVFKGQNQGSAQDDEEDEEDNDNDADGDEDDEQFADDEEDSEDQ